MQRAYLAISINNRKLLDRQVKAIKETLSAAGISLFIFVDQYYFTAEQEKEMMQQAFKEIDASDILIAELSEKAIGVGIEAGYAIAKGKKLWYIRDRNAPHSTTVSGAAHQNFLYEDSADLSNQIQLFLGASSGKRP